VNASTPSNEMQRRLWAIQHRSPFDTAYNLSRLWHFRGQFEPAAFLNSLRRFCKEHPIVRSQFEDSGGSLVPIDATEAVARGVSVVDLGGLDSHRAHRRAIALSTRLAAVPFVLEQAPLFRIAVYSLDAREHFICLVAHHTIFDGASFQIFVQEVLLRRSRERTATASRTTSGRTLGSPMIDLAAWRRILDGTPARAAPPPDGPLFHASSDPRRGERVFVELAREARDKLSDAARRRNATLPSLALAAYALSLAALGAPKRMRIAIPIRLRTKGERTIGVAVGTLLADVDTAGGDPEACLISAVGAIRAAIARRHTAPETLMRAVVEATGDPAAPLAQVMFNYFNTSDRTSKFADGLITVVDLDPGGAMFDISLIVEDTTETLHATFEYDRNIYRADTIRRLAITWIRMLEIYAEALQAAEALGTSLPPGWRPLAAADGRFSCLPEHLKTPPGWAEIGGGWHPQITWAERCDLE
jgi:hypothetical protein